MLAPDKVLPTDVNLPDVQARPGQRVFTALDPCFVSAMGLDSMVVVVSRIVDAVWPEGPGVLSQVLRLLGAGAEDVPCTKFFGSLRPTRHPIETELCSYAFGLESHIWDVPALEPSQEGALIEVYLVLFLADLESNGYVLTARDVKANPGPSNNDVLSVLRGWNAETAASLSEIKSEISSMKNRVDALEKKMRDP
ncbi:hypothetical protein HPB51_021593 [Rhipicephalus microplus]|uniref:Uncharacterized protein n=1 Tax=Rhipicephalus microplus TaxID=6941 RepID=A0A9J6EIE5_RHIMP|nr:hypothetical protein HPB51_021593 [Rhipicephalus microplus]